MNHLFLLQAFGDNLISLKLLSNYPNNSFKVHGTALSREIIKIVPFTYTNFVQIYDNIPAFYNIKKSTLINIFRDFIHLVRYIRYNIPVDERIFFEKDDFRFKLLKIFCFKHNFVAAKRRQNIYIDRFEMLKSHMNSKEASLVSSHSFKLTGKCALINPTGRNKLRHISPAVLEELLRHLKQHGFSVCLIDHLTIYSAFAEKVDNYYSRTSLEDAVEILKNSDLYCGPDSLFMHLAYFYEKPFFCVMNYDSSYFLPPESDFCSCIIYGENKKELSVIFSAFLGKLNNEVMD